MNKKILFLILSLVLLLPAIGFAQLKADYCGPETGTPCVGSLPILISNILTAVWVVFAGLAVICFIYAGMMFLTATGEPEKLKLAKSAVIWGIVGIIVAIIAFSIVTIISNALGGGNGCTISGRIGPGGTSVCGTCRYTDPITGITITAGTACN